MRVLIDNCVPRKFARLIKRHEIAYARQLGWHELENGDLLAAAERAGFGAMVTTDKNFRYQQNLTGRKISVIVLAPRLVFFENLAPLIGQLDIALATDSEGSFVLIKPENEA
jgi:predicted nuclease of predicted toxin-antitoxin system